MEPAVVGINSNVIPKLHATQVRALQRINEEDFTLPMQVVKRGSPQYGDEYIQGGFAALRQYYKALVLDPLNPHALSPEVDEFAHAHLLPTKAYDEFCKDVYGCRLFHQPLDHADDEAVTRMSKCYRYTTDTALPLLFDFVDAKFWPQHPNRKLVCNDDFVHNRFGDMAVLPKVQH